jgi:hypothetical protein
VSSFGFGGTNGHAIVKGANASENPEQTHHGIFYQIRFSWREVLHPFLRGTNTMADSGILSECPIGHQSMLLFRDHRVMGSVVLPGVNHFGLVCAAMRYVHPDSAAVV